MDHFEDAATLFDFMIETLVEDQTRGAGAPLLVALVAGACRESLIETLYLLAIFPSGRGQNTSFGVAAGLLAIARFWQWRPNCQTKGQCLI